MPGGVYREPTGVRTASGSQAGPQAPQLIHYAAIDHLVSVLGHDAANNRRIGLQPREFRLLEYLMCHADQVVTRAMLLEQVWEFHFEPRTSIVETHISRLRSKVDKGFGIELLHTVRGAGYRLQTPR